MTGASILILQSPTSQWESRLLSLAKEAQNLSSEVIHPVPISDRPQPLDAAFQMCQSITAAYSRSFYLASSLLPVEKRDAMRVLYAFCRTADNLSDDGIEDAGEKLDQLYEGLWGCGVASSSPVIIAWNHIRARYDIPLSYAGQLIDGVRRDLAPHRYQTFDDLALYCYGVASTVGLMSMHISGYAGPEAIPYAIKLGVALQLTNILRDIDEDWANGRLYLPLDEMTGFGIGEEHIAAHTVDERWRAFMRFQIARTRKLFAEAIPGILLLHPDGRLAIAAAAFLYRGILDDIERHDYNVFGRRAFVNRWRKLLALGRAFVYSKQNKSRPVVEATQSQLLSERQNEY